jgi:signal transduction histidine kinase
MDMSPISRGTSRFRLDAKWRIAAAAAGFALLMCGALVFTARSHAKSVRTTADARVQRENMLAAERATSAFWREREAMSEFLAFPLPRIAVEVAGMRLHFEQALRKIAIDSPAEQAQLAQARAANDRLIGIFDERSTLSGHGVVDDRQARRLHVAESSVLTPIAWLEAANRRHDLRAERASDSAKRAASHVELATSILGLAAVVLFVLFAVRLVRRIDNQNVELQLADTAKDEFIGTVSHELRTPLTSMNGFVELLLEEDGDPLTDDQRSYLATVQRGSTRLEGLINDLLLTAQVRSGQLEIRKTSTDLVEVVRNAVKSAQPHAGQNAIQLSMTAPSWSIPVEADVVRLGQAIDNVISNAIKFTPAVGRVTVTVAQSAHNATLAIADTGMGMTAADIERLFERFFRTDSAHAKQIQGTGLGLPIVKAIVDAHDGVITVTSEPNVGTAFVITLPLATAAGRHLSAVAA